MNAHHPERAGRSASLTWYGQAGFRLAAGDSRVLAFVPWESLDPFFEAVVQATEEAVVNALVANEDMTGRDGHRTPALPRARVAALLAAAGRLAE
jgi:D-aminopeptidase